MNNNKTTPWTKAQFENWYQESFVPPGCSGNAVVSADYCYSPGIKQCNDKALPFALSDEVLSLPLFGFIRRGFNLAGFKALVGMAWMDCIGFGRMPRRLRFEQRLSWRINLYC